MTRLASGNLAQFERKIASSAFEKHLARSFHDAELTAQHLVGALHDRKRGLVIGCVGDDATSG